MTGKNAKSKYKEIRKLLEEEQQRLLSSAKVALAERQEEPVNRDVEEIDVSTSETLRSTELRLRDRERYLLQKIEDAIERIDSETYGFCKLCEEEIPVARLKARPVTDLCISCKENQEKEEKNKLTRRQQRMNEDYGNMNF